MLDVDFVVGEVLTGPVVVGVFDEPALLGADADADADATGAALCIVEGAAVCVIVGIAAVVGAAMADGTGGVMP